MDNQYKTVMISAIVIAFVSIYVFINSVKPKPNDNVQILQKQHAMYQEAFSDAVKKYGYLDNWNVTTSQDFFSKIKEFLPVDRICGYEDRKEVCWVNDYLYLNRKSRFDMGNKKFFKFILNDESTGAIYLDSPKCLTNHSKTGRGPLSYICATLFLDVDGKYGLNTYGIDLFQFAITQKGKVIPRGDDDDGLYGIMKYCKDTEQTGEACAGRVLKEKNQNYLRK